MSDDDLSDTLYTVIPTGSMGCVSNSDEVQTMLQRSYLHDVCRVPENRESVHCGGYWMGLCCGARFVVHWN